MLKSIKKEWLVLGAILLVFVGLRLPAVGTPYHQDEYKWVLYSHPEIIPPGTVPHPPLTEFIYTTFGPMLGDDNFRFIPLAFAVANLFLIFQLSKIIFRNKETALLSAGIFAISFLSVIASVTVDVDGAVMPFFFMIMAIGYFKLKESGFKLKTGGWKWAILIAVGAVGGFMLKMSGVLPIAAIFLDFIIERRIFSDAKKTLKYALWGIGICAALFLILLGAGIVFPFFNLEYSFGYWKHFAVFAGRGWLQTFIQFAKAILYASPLLIVLVFLIDREIWRKTRPLFLFVLVGLLFYLVAFDFSLGALDRYMQFLAVPLSIASAGVVAKIFGENKKPTPFGYLVLAVALAFGIFALQFVSHAVPPLYPKTEWLERIASLRWNFLFPFMGGSGPLPFYMSWVFMAVSWIVSAVLLLLMIFRPRARKYFLVIFLLVSLVYNAMFAEEYIAGDINGNARSLVENAVGRIKEDESIKNVTVYNDIGGFDVMQTGKYRKRLYIDPKFDIAEKVKTLNTYKEHYMVIDIPHIEESTVYARYFSSCLPVHSEKSGYISGIIYDCTNAPDIAVSP